MGHVGQESLAPRRTIILALALALSVIFPLWGDDSFDEGLEGLGGDLTSPSGVGGEEDSFGDLRTLPDEPLKIFAETITLLTRQSDTTVGKSPAAAFVITQEMIRRSGARSTAELLRMVPGLQVSRIDGNKWSVSSRGFSGRFARKLLVQIDGRMVYTPLFGGTWWDAQDVLLHDLERVEVIRGPGATAWGANAVNGIINFVTKDAAETQGAYAEVGGGTEERFYTAARVGGSTDSGVNWRVYGKFFERDHQFEAQGREFDDWRQGRLGFRADWESCCNDKFMFQGDIYNGESGNAADQPPIGFRNADEPVYGGHVLGRWTRTFDKQSDMSFQFYYDRTDRRVFTFDQNINILDFDFQHRFRWRCYHNIVWGLGYRRVWDDLPTLSTPSSFDIMGTQRTTELPSAFIQDEINLIDDELYFTLGTKVSDNAFTDFEVQPSARLLWVTDERSVAWGAVSRAVRTPSRTEHDARLLIGEFPPTGSGIPLTIVGNRGVGSEELLAYEIGYRRQPNESVSWDLALFYNVYEDLITSRASNPPSFPPTFDVFNGDRGHAYGLELSADWQINDCWKISGWYSFLQMDIATDPRSIAGGDVTEGASAHHQAFLMSSMDIGCDTEFDLMARYVDSLPAVNVPSYISLDARLAWRPSCDVELSLVGQNLLDSQHPEYGGSIFTGEVPTEVQRGVYGMLTWGY